jgi:hypothetical protein
MMKGDSSFSFRYWFITESFCSIFLINLPFFVICTCYRRPFFLLSRKTFPPTRLPLFGLFRVPISFPPVCTSYQHSYPCALAAAADSLGFPQFTFPSYPSDDSLGFSRAWRQQVIYIFFLFIAFFQSTQNS